MEKSDKILLIISSVVIVLLLFSVGSLYMMKESEKDKKMSLQKQFDILTIEKQNLETKLRETEVLSAQTSATLKFQEEKISLLSKELDDEKDQNGKNVTKIQEKEFEIQSLKAKLEDAKIEKEEVLRNLEKTNETYLNMKFQLENLMKTKEELEKKASELAEKEGVSLGTVIIKRSN